MAGCLHPHKNTKRAQERRPQRYFFIDYRVPGTGPRENDLLSRSQTGSYPKQTVLRQTSEQF